MLALVTTDQGPNAAFADAFRERMRGMDVDLAGALDGLTRAEIDELAAAPAPYPIQSVLAGGSTRDIDISLLAPLVSGRAREMAGRGASAIVVCCAGDFPEVDCGVPVLYPGRLLTAIAGSITSSGRVGVVSPIPAQMDAASRVWRAAGLDPVLACASAFDSREISGAAARMASADVDLVVLDCMDHTAGDRDGFARLCGKPVLAPQPLSAKMASELFAR